MSENITGSYRFLFFFYNQVIEKYGFKSIGNQNHRKQSHNGNQRNGIQGRMFGQNEHTGS